MWLRSEIPTHFQRTMNKNQEIPYTHYFQRTMDKNQEIPYTHIFAKNYEQKPRNFTYTHISKELWTKTRKFHTHIFHISIDLLTTKTKIFHTHTHFHRTINKNQDISHTHFHRTINKNQDISYTHTHSNRTINKNQDI